MLQRMHWQNRLQQQVHLAQKIKREQTDLDGIKQEYEVIRNQVNQEKSKLAKSIELQKLIQFREKDLAKTKIDRKKLSDMIAKEKKDLVKKTNEEKSKLKLQKSHFSHYLMKLDSLGI